MMMMMSFICSCRNKIVEGKGESCEGRRGGGERRGYPESTSSVFNKHCFAGRERAAAAQCERVVPTRVVSTYRPHHTYSLIANEYSSAAGGGSPH